MDLRVFFQKMRQLEREISQEHVVVVSHETPDGGREGNKTEVSRALAARLIVEGKARLANQEETAAYHAAQEAHRLQAEEKALSERIVLNLAPQTTEIKTPRKPAKE